MLRYSWSGCLKHATNLEMCLFECRHAQFAHAFLFTVYVCEWIRISLINCYNFQMVNDMHRERGNPKYKKKKKKEFVSCNHRFHCVHIHLHSHSLCAHALFNWIWCDLGAMRRTIFFSCVQWNDHQYRESSEAQQNARCIQ